MIKRPLLTVLAIVLMMPSAASAATLYFLPAASTVTTGNIVTLTAYVNSQGVAINNSDAVIEYPRDLLQAISVSKSSSIFGLWVVDPAFSNATGQLSYNGGIKNPGYTGSNGQIVSVTFRTLKAGTATVLFSEAAVRANDGLGTDVLTTKSVATVTIASPQVVPDVPTPPPAGTVTGAPPKITSSTHPDQDVWYNNAEVALSWTLPDNATGVQTALDTKPDGAPRGAYAPSFSHKNFTKVDDGTSYFHIRYQTSGGKTSSISSYRLHIDTVSPTSLAITTNAESSDAEAIRMSAVDALSGMDRYILTIDQGGPITVAASRGGGAASTTLTGLSLGSHMLTVQAYDRAGNMIEATSLFTVSSPIVGKTEWLPPLPPVTLQIGTYTIELLSLIIPILALMLLLAALLYGGWYRFFSMRHRLRKDLELAKTRAHQALKTLSEELTGQLADAEQAAHHRKRTPAEAKAIAELRATITAVDTYIEKMLQKIEDVDL